MSMRCGYSVGRTTDESSLNDQLKRYKMKVLRAEDGLVAAAAAAGGATGAALRGFSNMSLGSGSNPSGPNSAATTADPNRKDGRAPNPAHETLQSKCIKLVVQHFESRPVTEVIPAHLMNEIVAQLPTTLSPVIGARYIYNENYWKRCCVEKYGWHNCILANHGYLWKQMYFEKLLMERLEDFDVQTDALDDLLELPEACMDYIFEVSFKQLPSHIDLSEVLLGLPNLTKIDITYGVNKIGMNYERILFGMKISDATSLAKTFDMSESLTTIVLTGNMIDDDLLRMLMTGLIKNNTIAHIDLSHNKITNHGARLISKLLGENSVVTTLILADNQIHSEGGRYIARGLRENDSLLKLNLRLNRLGDEGVHLLFEGLQDNVTLTDLNISSNGAGNHCSRLMISALRNPDHRIQSLDLSGNEFDADFFTSLKSALANNKTLTRLDLRKNPGFEESISLVNDIEKITHSNEVQLRNKFM